MAFLFFSWCSPDPKPQKTLLWKFAEVLMTVWWIVSLCVRPGVDSGRSSGGSQRALLDRWLWISGTCRIGSGCVAAGEAATARLLLLCSVCFRAWASFSVSNCLREFPQPFPAGSLRRLQPRSSSHPPAHLSSLSFPSPTSLLPPLPPSSTFVGSEQRSEGICSPRRKEGTSHSCGDSLSFPRSAHRVLWGNTAVVAAVCWVVVICVVNRKQAISRERRRERLPAAEQL